MGLQAQLDAAMGGASYILHLIIFPIPLHHLPHSFAFLFGEGSTLFFEGELAARSIDIITHSMTDSRRYSCSIEHILEFFDHDLTRRLESVTHDPFSWIIGDEVHMCELPFEETCELMCIFRTISHSCYHDIFVEYSFIRLLCIAIECFHQLVDGIGILDWHDTLPSFIVWSMK